MKRKKTAALCFGLLAAVCFLMAAVLAVRFRGATPVLVSAPPEAARQVEALMEAVCGGDFSQAEALLYGTPELGLDREPEDPVGALLWQAYVDSLDYALSGSCYASENGVCQDVKIISLELPSVTEGLGERARELLNRRLEQAEDVSEIYDEDNEYRQELVQEVLLEAARQALEEDARYGYRIVTLRLVYDREQWWVAADAQLLQAVSGGIGGQ